MILSSTDFTPTNFLNFFLPHQMDTLVFIGLSFGGMFVVHLWLRRMFTTKGVPWRVWFLLTVLVVVGIFSSAAAGNRTKQDTRHMLQGFAPTYAQELEKMGHWKIRLDTPADDPLYLSLIHSEIRWLKVNPSASDIYTFRKREDGKIVLVVDSETDYDQNGKYEGEREKRTPIGEVYPESDEALERAFSGIPQFDDEPYTDRWGTWVSAYVPVRDQTGRVEAVLGVDYAADKWMSSILWERITSFGLVFILISILIGSAAFVTATFSSEEKFRTLSESAPEGIFMTDQNGNCLYVNAEYQRMAGLTQSEVMGKGWAKAIHPEDREKVFNYWYECVKNNKAFKMDYRFQAPEGRVSWLAGNAVSFHNEQGEVMGYIGTVTDFTQKKILENEQEKLIGELKEALEKVKTLSGLLPICYNCKKIKDDAGYWQKLEHYIERHSSAEFTHGLCPDCYKTLSAQIGGSNQAP